MTNIIFDQAPPVFKNYLKLIFGRKKGVPGDGHLPEISITLPKVEVPGALLSRFVKISKLPNTDYLPITFPYVLAGPVHLALMAHPDFPVKAAGLLHLRNRINYPENIPTGQGFSLSVQTSSSRFRPQGFEFEIITSVKINDKVYWECKSTF